MSVWSILLSFKLRKHEDTCTRLPISPSSTFTFCTYKSSFPRATFITISPFTRMRDENHKISAYISVYTFNRFINVMLSTTISVYMLSICIKVVRPVIQLERLSATIQKSIGVVMPPQPQMFFVLSRIQNSSGAIDCRSIQNGCSRFRINPDRSEHTNLKNN